MADLISREALIAEINRIGGHWLSGWDTAGVLSLASRISAVDAVEVVRCKDCKLWDSDPDTYGNSIGPKGKCMKSFETMICDDFCSHGERREE